MGYGLLQRDGAVVLVGEATGRNKRRFQDAPDDDWLSGVVHDLNNELAILKGQVDLLRRRAERAGVMERGPLFQSLSPVDAATRNLMRLTGELHDLRRLQSGRALGLARRRSDLVALARQIVIEQQQITERHTINLETGQEAIIGWWDAARLGRVLGNLLGNALKYCPRGAITVRLR